MLEHIHYGLVTSGQLSQFHLKAENSETGDKMVPVRSASHATMTEREGLDQQS